MTRFEYKTVILSFKTGVLKQGLPDIEGALNEQAAEGWRLQQMVLPSSHLGSSDSMVAILERERRA